MAQHLHCVHIMGYICNQNICTVCGFLPEVILCWVLEASTVALKPLVKQLHFPQVKDFQASMADAQEAKANPEKILVGGLMFACWLASWCMGGLLGWWVVILPRVISINGHIANSRQKDYELSGKRYDHLS